MCQKLYDPEGNVVTGFPLKDGTWLIHGMIGYQNWEYLEDHGWKKAD